MVISNYVRFYEVEDAYFIFNVMTKCILQVNKDIFSFLRESHDELCVSQHLPDEIIQDLYNRRFIVDDLRESIEYCVGRILNNRRRNDFKHITIVPTTDCCFACYYCFEKNKSAVYMNDSTIDNIISYIISEADLKRLHITWFGGEPLMAKDIIAKISCELRKLYKGEYSSDIITNGYFLDRESVYILKNSNIREIQISLDGGRENHNRVKYMYSDSDVYETTLQNIENMLKEFPLARVSLRVNFTKNKKIDFITSYGQLVKRFCDFRNITISPGFVMNKDDITSCNGNSCVYFNFEDRNKCAIDLWKNNNIPSGRILYNDYTTECAVRNPNSIVIDPMGKIYRCWEHLGNEKYSVGEIAEKGKVIFKNSTWVDALLSISDPLRIEKCRSCCFLPICYGGCPVERYYTTDKQNCIIDPNVFDNLIKCHLEYILPALNANNDVDK